MEDIVIIGFGGHGKSLTDCIERSGRYNIVGYTDIKDNAVRYPYLGTDDKLKEIYESGVRYAAIGVGYLGHGDLRERIYKELKVIGFELPIICDPSSVISETAVIGEGTFIGKCAVVNAEAKIGKVCILNTGAILEHECRVGDFAHVAVGAVICGQAEIGEAALIGANATVIQCKSVKERKIVPAGDVVR